METTPLRERREDIPAMINLFLGEATDAVVRLANQRDLYRIEEDALALLCQFDYPGNIRSLRNLIYELTSYIEDEMPISGELVQFALARLSSRAAHNLAEANSDRKMSPVFGNPLTSEPDLSNIDLACGIFLKFHCQGRRHQLTAGTLHSAARRNLQAMDRTCEALQH